MSRFIARQKTSWAQARVNEMTIEEIKMVHIVKLIPDMKLREECAKILSKQDAKLEDIEKKVADYEMSKSMAANIHCIMSTAGGSSSG